MIKFNFIFSGDVSFGCGVADRVADRLAERGWTKVILVVDHNLLNVAKVQQVTDKIRQSVHSLVEIVCQISEPTYATLESNRVSSKEVEVDAVIGIGGGSAIDFAKGMAVLYRNHLSAIRYRGFNKMTEPVLPIIAIPTTAGTGSEITPNASFVDSEKKRKLGINGAAVRPRYAYLDPALTVSCPEKPTISAGVDSLVHATEAYVAKRTNPMARLFAREAFKLVFDTLPQVVDSPSNLELRSKVMYGAFLAAIALMNSGTGPAAAMSYPLGVHFHVPHGIAGGIFLPHVIAYNVRRGVTDYADLYEAVECAETSLSRDAMNQRLVEDMFATWNRMGVPCRLSGYGFGAGDVDMFIKDTLELKAALDQNPVPFHEPEIEGILEKLI